MRNNWLISGQLHYGGTVVDLDSYIKIIMEFYDYIIIWHNSDLETDLHFHAILINVDTNKNKLLELFPTCDIEIQRGSNKTNYDYLLHRRKKDIEAGKVPYNASDIITNIDVLEEIKSKTSILVIISLAL